MRIAVILALVAGCVPVTRETARVTRTFEPPVAERPTRPVLRVDAYDGVVDVVATWQRSCRRRVRDVVQVTQEHAAILVGTTDGNVWGWFVAAPLLVLAWPLGIADVVIANGTAIAQGTTTATHVAEAGTVVTPCSLRAANIPLHLTLASGTRVDATTDRDGHFSLVLPTSEPPGPISVTTDTELQLETEREVEPPPGVELELPAPVAPPALTPPTPAPPTSTGLPAVARAAVKCAGQLGLAGMAKIRVAVAPDGAITDVQVDRGDELVRCMRSELATARFPPSGSAQTLELPLMLRRR